MALKQWMRTQLKIAGQLNALADYYAHDALRSQLEHLQRARFSTEQHDWQEGKALWRALQGAIETKRKAQQPPRTELPKLYPN